MIHSINKRLLCLCLTVAFGISPLLSANAKPGTGGSNNEFGISAGFWLSGDINVWNEYIDFDVTKESSLMVRAILDTYVAEKLCVGLYGNYSPFTVEDQDGTMIEIGGSIKPKLMLNPTIVCKPGLNIGYRKISADQDQVDDIEALGVNLSIELQFLSESDYTFYIDGGFLAQPAGGNDYVDATFGPIMYILGGISF